MRLLASICIVQIAQWFNGLIFIYIGQKLGWGGMKALLVEKKKA